MDIEDVLKIEPYSLDRVAKRQFLNERLRHLTQHHYEHCVPYRKMMDAVGLDMSRLPEYEDLPFLPVRLFKELELCSCEKEEVVKTMTSSGTSGQKVSRIYLDRVTSAAQTKCLTRIVSDYLGTKRVPMLILDSSSVVKNRAMFSARGAGILGFSMFGNTRQYALNEEMELDVEGLKQFLLKHENETIFLFGFTFMVWQHFYKKLTALVLGGLLTMSAGSVSAASTVKLNLDDAVQMALENNRDIKSALADVDAAKWNLSNYRRQTGATLSLSSSANHGNNDFAAQYQNKVTGQADKTNYANSATVSIPLYNFSLRSGIRRIFGRKGEAVVESNIKAFDAGLQYSQKFK